MARRAGPLPGYRVVQSTSRAFWAGVLGRWRARAACRLSLWVKSTLEMVGKATGMEPHTACKLCLVLCYVRAVQFRALLESFSKALELPLQDTARFLAVVGGRRGGGLAQAARVLFRGERRCLVQCGAGGL